MMAQQAVQQAISALNPGTAEEQPTEKKVNAKDLNPGDFTQPYLEFMTGSPTVFHATSYFKEALGKAGYTEVCPSR